MAEVIARYEPGKNVPVFAGSLITAGHFVKVTGAKTDQGDYPAAHCGAGEWALGVAERDSAPTSLPAHSHDRRVNVHRPGGIARVVAGAAVSVGDEVQSDATGRAVTRTTGLALGKALTAAGTAGDVIEVETYGAPGLGATGELAETPWAPGAAVTDLTDSTGASAGDEGTVSAMPTLTDTPADADALRDDIVTNMVPVINENFSELTAKLNALLASLRTADIIDT